MDINQDATKTPKIGRPPKDNARRSIASIRMTEDEKRAFLDAVNKYGTAVMLGVIFGSIAQLNHDAKKAQK